ncbi:hypothetical protein [Agromyces larvae]|uniref:Uncharacterized protein n=1 Tax=Agromyces larvae TaxID=2929802 RepID=A0ABY4BY48_9MICO|nr:hypothetical protein [Agromyces larvae]UOE42643.1 hypothetical protein MTO99_10595 [Agromyces larvae]
MPDLEALATDPRFVAALSAARYERFEWHEALLAVGDMEVLYLVRSVGGRFSLNLKSRSSAERERATADELELIVDFLRFLVRSDVQVVHRGDTLPPGFQIEPGAGALTLVAPDEAWRLTVPDGTAARVGLVAFAVEGRDR